MFLKDHLKDTYKKASLEKNNLILENLINRWAHRFGIESLDELVVRNQGQINLIGEEQEEENQGQINLIEEEQEEEKQGQINLIEEEQEEENQGQINLASLENTQHQKDLDFKSKEGKTNNTEIVNKNINESRKYDYKYIESEELPLPNINNLRKWIKNEKKAS